MPLVDDGYALTPPRLATDDDVGLLRSFPVGTEWWEQDVEDWLQDDCLSWQRRGYCRTSLFFLEGIPGLTAIVSAAPKALEFADLGNQFGIPKRSRPGWRTVPAVYIAWFAIHKEFRSAWLGEEVHTMLLDSIRQSLFGTHWVWLHVWEDNPAIRFWERLDYKFLEAEPEAQAPRRETQPRRLLKYGLYLGQ